jgi:hypothetical protein
MQGHCGGCAGGERREPFRTRRRSASPRSVLRGGEDSRTGRSGAGGILPCSGGSSHPWSSA